MVSQVFVKPEPQDSTLEGTKESTAALISGNALYKVKQEPENLNSSTGDAMGNGPVGDQLVAEQRQTPKLSFTLYQNAQDIEYIPENVLEEGLGMVKSIKDALKKLELGSKLRQDVWAREIDGLLGQGTPKTLIAVCGATGAGKSSVLNAVLDDNVVPTSGMRACTAVVTEISYHKKSTIDADVAFLSEAEWRQELDILLKDLVDEDGNIKRLNDLRSEAGVAWQKVHAVYPSIDQERLVRMNATQIIQSDENIMSILGKVKTISTKDSKAFGKEIARYIDSKEKRTDKKDKEKGKSKQKHNEPALWPLIRQVKVRCKAAALSTGAILVDLPGVSDANAARDNIAKDYMKKCKCIWILAPIQRAVDDKTAKELLGTAFKSQLRNGGYDGYTITFIASKNDDISCSEVIPVLNLDENPDLEAIQSRIFEYSTDTNKYKKLKKASEVDVKGLHDELSTLRTEIKDHEAHIQALKNGEPFESTLTKKTGSKGNKRKNTRGGKKAPKRRRSMSNSSDEDDGDEDDDFSDDSDSEVDAESDKSDSDSDSDDNGSKKSRGSGSDSEKDSDDEEAEIEEIVIIDEDSLKDKIKKCKEAIKALRAKLEVARQEKKSAADALAVAEKQLAKAQREKNAFCALKRGEYAKAALKIDFREGLKELDDEAAQKLDPDNFDTTKNLRDYDAIDLPVFTVSSRDYVRIKGQVKGDGVAACFSNVEDTGIPDLQKWCLTLTVASRDTAARMFLTHLAAFTSSIYSYVQGIGDVTAVDKNDLRERWESNTVVHRPQEHDFWATMNDRLYMVDRKPKLDAQGRPAGIAPRLMNVFEDLVKKCVEDLQQNFKDGLEDKCRDGAAQATVACLPILDEFTMSMHWGTYRATLRRHGQWRRDLNVEFINPFTKSIASTWATVFESDLFADFEEETVEAIEDLVKDVEESAAVGLRDRAKRQGELSIEEARLGLQNAVGAVKAAINVQQKEISRCLAPHVQRELIEGYDEAMEFRGIGSVARQKAFFRDYVSCQKGEMFEDCVDTVMERLTQAAEAVGHALSESMEKLAQKVEVSLAVLWEGMRDDPQQLLARDDVLDVVKVVREQISLWSTADKLRQSAAHDGVSDAYAMEVDA